MDALYRHAPVCGSYCDGPRMEYRADGDWVRVEDFDAAEKQRDEARAEVERLRTAIGNALTNGHMNALCWATNDDECVGRCRLLRDALKEGA